MAVVRPTGPPPEITTGVVVVALLLLFEGEEEGGRSSFCCKGSVVVVESNALLEKMKGEKQVESLLSSPDLIIIQCAAAIFFSFYLSFIRE